MLYSLLIILLLNLCAEISLNVIYFIVSINFISVIRSEVIITDIISDRIKILSSTHFVTLDRLCSLVVRIPGYRSKGPGFDYLRYQIY
jgi:hypothetical protein